MKKILIVDDQKAWIDYHQKNVLDIFKDAEIYTADSATEAYHLLLKENEVPFDIVLTDMQMENDFEPKYAGEWLIEQIKTFKSFNKTKIVIISATYNISAIAENYNVDYIRKATVANFPNSYGILID